MELLRVRSAGGTGPGENCATGKANELLKDIEKRKLQKEK